MKELLILVQAHNEQGQISECIESLKQMVIPEGYESQLYVVLDRCTDQTKDIIQELGVNILEKNFSGDYKSHTANNLIFALDEIEYGQYILKCDADIQEIPDNVLHQILPHLIGDVKRISPDIRSKSGKWWLDFLFWLRDLNMRITPLGNEPRGGFCLFSRETVERIGFDRSSNSWDTGFDNRIKRNGGIVKKVDTVAVVEKRDFTLKRIINTQISSGKTRRQLKISGKRTLLHSVFRFRPFVLSGYVVEMVSGG